MDLLFLAFYWPFFIGVPLLIAAVVTESRSEEAQAKLKKPKKKKLKFFQRLSKAALVLAIVGLIFCCVFPVTHYFKIRGDENRLRESSLGDWRTGPFQLYSLGSGPVKGVKPQQRIIDFTTMGPHANQNMAYFEEDYSSPQDDNSITPGNYDGTLIVYEYANPTKNPDQACSTYSYDGSDGANTTGPDAYSCKVVDANNGRPIYGYGNYDLSGKWQPSVLTSTYGTTRIEVSYGTQNTTYPISQELKVFKNLKPIDANKVHFFIPSSYFGD